MLQKITFDRFTVFATNKGENFLVDNDAVDAVSKYSWCKDNVGYLCANIGGKVVRLHDFVMRYNGIVKPTGYYVDHINLDKLDNRITNLRIVAPTENSMNVPLKSDNRTGVTGVCMTKDGKYRAYITIKKKRIELGTYPTLQEAALARSEAETRLGFKTRPRSIAFLCEMEA